MVSSPEYIYNRQIGGRVAYATSLRELRENMGCGRISVLSVHASATGAGALRAALGNNLYSIALLPSAGSKDGMMDVLRHRLIQRRRDAPEAIEQRLAHQEEPLQFTLENPTIESSGGTWPVFDHVMVNETLDAAVEEVDGLFSRWCLGR